MRKFSSKELLKIEKKNEILFNKSYKTEKKDFYTNYNLLCEMIHKVLYRRFKKRKMFDDDELATVNLTARYLASSEAAYVLIAKGLFLDYAVIFRTMFENVLLCAAILENPNLGKKWIRDKKISPSVVRSIAIKDKTMFGRVKKLYSELSEIQHLSIRPFARHSIINKKSSFVVMPVPFVVEFNKKAIKHYFALSSTTLLMIKLFDKKFHDELPKNISDEISRIYKQSRAKKNK